jgi:hypothetical protein
MLACLLPLCKSIGFSKKFTWPKSFSQQLLWKSYDTRLKRMGTKGSPPQLDPHGLHIELHASVRLQFGEFNTLPFTFYHGSFPLDWWRGPRLIFHNFCFGLGLLNDKILT